MPDNFGCRAFSILPAEKQRETFAQCLPSLRKAARKKQKAARDTRKAARGNVESYPGKVKTIMNGKNLRNSLQNCRRKAAPLQRVDIIKYLYGSKTAVVEHLLLHQPQAVAHTLHVDSVLQLEHNLADMQGLHLGNGRLVGA